MNVFITGASGGLGRELANECGRRGYNLFLTDINESGLSAFKPGWNGSLASPSRRRPAI